MATSSESAYYTFSGSSGTLSGGAVVTNTESDLYVTAGGSVVVVDEALISTGDDEAAVYIDSGSVVLSNSVILTTGSGGHGIYATGSGTSVTVDGGVIDVTAADAHAVYLFSGAVATLSGTVITTSGSATGGALETDTGGGTITAVDVTVTTVGVRSPDLFAAGNNSVITVTSSLLSASEAEVGTTDAAGNITLIDDKSTGVNGIKVMMTVPGITTESSIVIDGGSLTATGGVDFLISGELNAASAVVTVENDAVLSASTGIIIEVTSGSTGTLDIIDDTVSGGVVADSSSSTVNLKLTSGSTFYGYITDGESVSIGSDSVLDLVSASNVDTITNEGEIKLASGTLVVSTSLVNDGSLVWSGGSLDNLGIVEAASGTTLISAAYLENYTSGVLSGGTWEVDDGATLFLKGGKITTLDAMVELNGSGTFEENSSSTTLQSTLTTIGSSGVLVLSDGQDFEGSRTLTDNGSIELTSATISEASLKIGTTGTLSGYGFVVGSVTNNGVIDASGGTLAIGGAISGSGTTEIAANSVLAVTGNIASTQSIVFDGTSAELELLGLSFAKGVIGNFVSGDSIVIADSGLTLKSYSFSDGVLNIATTGGVHETFDFGTSYSASDFSVTQRGSDIIISHS